MRVIAGKCRSLPLKALAGDQTRPTTDRIKETLFNIMMPYIPDCRFLDLFAGSGSIGIEALSRGAVYACFVEQSRKASEVIRDNLAFTKLADDAQVVTMDAVRAVQAMREEPFDVIFMDPPYRKDLEKEVLLALPQTGLMTDETLVVVEAALDTDFSWLSDTGYICTKVKEYKTNKHLFLRWGE